MKLIRSFLFAPGSNETVMEKAVNAGADAVILDLEDAVAVAEKEKARQAVTDMVTRGRSMRIYVRINSWGSPWCLKDLEAAIAANATGIVLPKAEDPAVVRRVADYLEPDQELIPLVETALGVLRANEIALASSKVMRLAFGAIDFTLDIGTTYSQSGTELFQARSMLVLACRAAGINPPVDTVNPNLNDIHALTSELNLVKQLGMFGKLSIHPKQLGPIHSAFTPSSTEIEQAHQVIKAFEKAEAEGIASIQLDGKFIDYPVVARARKILELSAQVSSPEY